MNNPILSMLAQGGAGKQNNLLSNLQNSPISMLLRFAQSGGNPMNLLSQMGGPQAQEAMRLINGKNPAQLRQLAEQMAAERGTTIEAIAQGLGLTLPK